MCHCKNDALYAYQKVLRKRYHAYCYVSYLGYVCALTHLEKLRNLKWRIRLHTPNYSDCTKCTNEKPLPAITGKLETKEYANVGGKPLLGVISALMSNCKNRQRTRN